MNFFTFDLRKVFLVITLIVLPLVAINMQRKSEEELWFTRPFSFAGSLIQQGFASFSSGVRGTTAMYLDLIGIKRENEALRNQLAELNAQLGAMTELKLENERLGQLLGFKQATKMDLLAARVIGRDLLPDHKTITVDRGLVHGVQKNMAALTIGGVIGYTFRVEKDSSQILLLTDTYAVIDAIVQRSRARGLVEGMSRNTCRLRHLKRSDDVRVGDLVVTSGLFNIFPKGFPIGTVTSIDKSRYGMTQDVEIKPAVEPLNLEELFIVLNANHQDLSTVATSAATGAEN
ncbi:MAG: rod shape-determining protein MreC [Bdellovibrionales bacterium]